MAHSLSTPMWQIMHDRPRFIPDKAESPNFTIAMAFLDLTRGHREVFSIFSYLTFDFKKLRWRARYFHRPAPALCPRHHWIGFYISAIAADSHSLNPRFRFRWASGFAKGKQKRFKRSLTISRRRLLQTLRIFCWLSKKDVLLDLSN